MKMNELDINEAFRADIMTCDNTLDEALSEYAELNRAQFTRLARMLIWLEDSYEPTVEMRAAPMELGRFFKQAVQRKANMVRLSCD